MNCNPGQDGNPANLFTRLREVNIYANTELSWLLFLERFALCFLGISKSLLSSISLMRIQVRNVGFPSITLQANAPKLQVLAHSTYQKKAAFRAINRLFR